VEFVILKGTGFRQSLGEEPMSNIFLLLTPVTYWLLIVMWLFILCFYTVKIRKSKSRRLFLTLMTILAIDAFRTLFESLYFGAWYTAKAGLIPQVIETVLVRPEMVIIPKFVNVIAAAIVIVLLLKRWLPEEERFYKKSEDALRQSEEKFSAFTNQSTDSIGVADVQGNYTYVNPAFCRLVGYSENELMAMTVFDVTSDSQDKATFAKSKGSGVGTPIHVVLKRKDGTDFLAEVVGTNIKYGEEQCVLGVVRDITEREQAEQEKLSLERQVQHAQKLESLGLLAGGIAHDFNNLLTAILGNADLALDELPDDSPARVNIQEIESASKRAAELARQMLAYSGKGRFIIQAICCRELVEEIGHLLDVSVSKKINIKHEYSDDSQTFAGDATQIRQVIMNLITNASESIGDKTGTITLSTGVMDCTRVYLNNINKTLLVSMSEPLSAGTYTYFEVTDTGCGMDDETMGKIFDPFFTTKFTGRGLGMSAVLGIVRGHRGALKVDSEVGKGTTFRILFPVSQEVPEIAENTIENQVSAVENEFSGTVLIAEDEVSVCKVGKRMLERLGFHVLTAYDGREALKVYSEHADELVCVLLDLTMPHMSGDEVFREIRQQDPKARVILCSGYSEQDVAQRFVGENLTGFIHKPYQLEALKKTLGKVIDGVTCD
jgi:PAS domain S-box-containing protein